jgi:hypothetical protein
VSSYQRRRGREATFWAVRRATDSRGNVVYEPDPSTKATVRVAAIPQRSSRAEAAGQVEIDVTRLIVPEGTPGVSLWSHAEFGGEEWDIVTPPELHYGTRSVRHWTIDLRRRPQEAPSG